MKYKCFLFVLMSTILIGFIFWNKDKDDVCLIERTVASIPDSSMLSIENYTTKKIHVGETITNIPLASQVINHNGQDKYLLLDEATIYIFDINNEELEDSINLSKCGNLNVYSGFN